MCDMCVCVTCVCSQDNIIYSTLIIKYSCVIVYMYILSPSLVDPLPLSPTHIFHHTSQTLPHSPPSLSYSPHISLSLFYIAHTHFTSSTLPSYHLTLPPTHACSHITPTSLNIKCSPPSLPSLHLTSPTS